MLTRQVNKVLNTSQVNYQFKNLNCKVVKNHQDQIGTLDMYFQLDLSLQTLLQNEFRDLVIAGVFIAASWKGSFTVDDPTLRKPHYQGQGHEEEYENLKFFKNIY